MTRHALMLSLAGLIVGVPALPAIGQDNLVVRGEPEQEVFQERVSYAELDLRNGGDQRTLRRRVSAASERVCRQAVGPLPDYGIGWGPEAGMTCVDLTKKDAQPQIRSAIRRAKAGEQLAVSGSISVMAAR